MTRAEFIQSVIDKYRGSFPQEFCFDNEDKPFVEYRYDAASDSLVAEMVSVPFHYAIEDINGELLDRKLDELEGLLIDYYKTHLGIRLLVPAD